MPPHNLRDTGLVTADFDPALSYAITVDHGLVQSYDLLCGTSQTPLVPLIVNTSAPPLPRLDRCVQLGRVLGTAIRAADVDCRVLIIASGGLSHWLPSSDPRDPALAPDRRAGVIHGRRDPHAFATAREPRIRAMGGDPAAPVDAIWDTWFLHRISAGDLDAITALGDTLELEAGSGANEIRTWLAARAAHPAPFVWTSYEPVHEWITGMGIATTFPVPAQR